LGTSSRKVKIGNDCLHRVKKIFENFQKNFSISSSYAGAVFGLPISAWLVSYTHWSAPFYIYGIAGVLWSIFWFSLTFERPAFHPTISAKEKEHIETSIGQVSQTQPTVCFF